MGLGIVILLLVSACGLQPLEKNIYRLPHPSAGGSLPPHTVDTSAGYRLSLTKVTSDEICIDAYVTSYSTRPERALANVKDRLKPDRDGIGFCRGQSKSFREYCEDNEPFPVKQVFEPVIYAVEFSKHASNSYRKTGNVEQVCVEELTNQRGIVVGCARYVEQDEEVEGWDAGVLFYSRGGWRSCVANKGLIGPTTKEFDFAFSVVPYRFVLEGGKSVDGPWGATGGTSAETPPVPDLVAAKAAAEAGTPTVTWVPSTPEKSSYGRAPKQGKFTTPAPTNAPVSAPAPAPAPAPPVAPPPAPEVPGDPLRARADKRFAVVVLQIVRDGKVLASIDAAGSVTMNGTAAGSWKDGAFLDRRGVAAIVVTSSGEVLTKGNKRLARISRDKLQLEDGTTMTIDASGRFKLAKGGKVEVSAATVKVDARGRRIALVMGLVSAGGLRFKPQP